MPELNALSKDLESTDTYTSLSLGDINLDLFESTEELLCINFVVSVKAVKVSEDSA